MSQTSFWDERYQGETYLFGEEPNAFLSRQKRLFPTHGRALAIADGEGRNGVWLAQQGLSVDSIDSSVVAQRKAARLAEKRGVTIALSAADLATWTFPAETYDVAVGIFFQFCGPDVRHRIFEGLQACLKPGGLLLLEGYTTEQLAFDTGGPKILENLYTEPMLRSAFADMQILTIESYVAELDEGTRHQGQSAIIDLIARKI